jgi:NodT family efflux transporter outer membrane factor (OMF) lipoprotein
MQPLSINDALPSKFPNQSTDTIALPVWREFIKDSLLISLLDIAIIRNQDIQTAFQRVEIAKAGIREAKSAMLPSGGLSSINSFRKFGLYTMDGAGNITTEITPGKIVPIHLPDYFLGGYATWEIDVWGKLKSIKKMAQSGFWQSREASKMVIGGILSEISTSYFQLISLDKRIELIDSTLNSQKRALLALIEQKEAGRANELAVQQFIGQTKEFELLKNETSLEILKLENYINLLIGRYPQNINRNIDISDQQIRKLSSVGLPSQMLENRPDVKFAYWEMEKNKCNVAIAKSRFFPSFKISSTYGFQAFDPKYLIQSPTSMAYSLLGNISAPLINRGAIKADFKRATAGQIESMLQYQKTILTSYIEIVDRLNRIDNLKSNLELRKDRVSALSKAMDASNELFKSSKATYLDILYARNTELDAQYELLINHAELVIEELQLYHSLGGFASLK